MGGIQSGGPLVQNRSIINKFLFQLELPYMNIATFSVKN